MQKRQLQSLAWEDPTRLKRTKAKHVPRLLSLCPSAREPQALKAAHHSERSHRPPQWRSSPCSQQLEKSPQGNQGPTQAHQTHTQ